MEKESQIYVFLDSRGKREKFVGTLFWREERGKETFSFEFNKEYLASMSGSYIQLDPELFPYSGHQYASSGKKIFGCFSDCCPDRWGRKLLERKEDILAEKEKRPRKNLLEIDYLLGVNDIARSGAFRFKAGLDDKKYIGENEILAVPPIASLRKLQQATEQYEKQKDIYEEKWLNQILEPGSSLGGSRPKAIVRDVDGSLWIAKFPSKNDEINCCAWEKVVNDLAVMAGLNVAKSRFEKFAKKSCFLSKRFDRYIENGKTNRIHFSSAMTQLGVIDGESSSSSYIDIADFIKSYGSSANKDLKELWNRMVFNIAVSNTDDHLRNHGFLLEDSGWSLSPLYDITPNPRKNRMALSLDGKTDRKSAKAAIEASRFFELTLEEAKNAAEKIFKTVRDNWHPLAAKYGISRSEQNFMRQAFENDSIS